MRGKRPSSSRRLVRFIPVAALWSLVLASGSASLAGLPSSGPEQASVASLCLVTPDAATELSLPQPLSEGDAGLLREVLDDQARGNLAGAERAAAGVRDRSLLASLFAPRSAPPYGRSGLRTVEAYKGGSKPGDGADHRNAPMEAAIDRLAQDQGLSAALQMIARATGPDRAEAAFLRAHLARSLFAADRFAEALRVASASLDIGSSDRLRGTAALIAGLAAWRLERIGLARGYFTDAAEAPLASDAIRAAAAFWAGRTALRLQGSEAQQIWLRRAGSRPWSFYGLIARRMLGSGPGSRETLSQADLDGLAALPAAHRAFAWLQLAQATRAEAEFRKLWPVLQNDPVLRRALLLVATRARLTTLAAQLAGLDRDAACSPPDDARLPMLPLRPVGGFRVDPALLYGIARTESNFDIGAVSAAGARGLMQIMPTTAKSVMGHARLTEALLRNPAFNLSLGQQVLVSMAHRPVVSGDLIRLLAAYNAGVGTVAGWPATAGGVNDPLLMIEAIPIDETRAFVQRVLTRTWIYAAKLGVPNRSLDDIAAGRSPRLAPPSAERTVAALMP